MNIFVMLYHPILKSWYHTIILEITKQVLPGVASQNSFSKVTLTEIIEIKNQDDSTAAQSNDIKTKVMQESYCLFSITDNFNDMMKNSVLQDPKWQSSRN